MNSFDNKNHMIIAKEKPLNYRATNIFLQRIVWHWYSHIYIRWGVRFEKKKSVVKSKFVLFFLSLTILYLSSIFSSNVHFRMHIHFSKWIQTMFGFNQKFLAYQKIITSEKCQKSLIVPPWKIHFLNISCKSKLVLA